ncbi:MAG: TspO/MBR family protein [Desulfobacterales bacterium]
MDEHRSRYAMTREPDRPGGTPHQNRRVRSLSGLAVWIALCLATGWAGSLVTDPRWYERLVQPSWSPPAYVFGPVWTLLYILMGAAAWLVWKEYGFSKAGGVLMLFLVHLLLNAGWSYLFFGMRAMGAALAELIVLWGMILAIVIGFGRKRRLAGVLMIPYLAWVAYAGLLNFSLWRLNS